jgi:hypothetical protein
MTKRMCFLLSVLVAAAAFAPVQSRAQGYLCGAIPGVWQWFTGETVYFDPNGFAHDGHPGYWRCWGGRVVIHWSQGAVDRLVLSPRGDYLSGFNQSGTQIWGQRR